MKSRSFPLRRTLKHDMKDVTQKIQDTEQELGRCNVEIARLKGALMKMEKKRDDVEERLEGYKSLRLAMAPINHMPPEVLVEIFKLSCPNTSYIGRRWVFESTPPPMCLAMVCGRWRELAISTPSLWVGLDFTMGLPRKSPLALQLFIERSKNQPLKLDLKLEHGLPFGNWLEVLVPVSDRWQSLVLRIKPSTTSENLHLIRGGLPNLVHLDLFEVDPYTITDHDGDYDDVFCRLFEHAPSLRSIALKSNRLVTSRLSLPWQQLDSVHLHSCILTRARQVLSLTPNVEYLKLDWISIDSSDEFDGHPITLAKLDTFRTGIRGAVFASDVFWQFDCPELRCLSLSTILDSEEWDPEEWDSGEWDAPWDISALKSFLCTHSSLTSLLLHQIPVSDRDMVSLLRLVPTLTTLIVRESRPQPPPSRSKPRRQQKPRPPNLTITTHFLRKLSYRAAPNAKLILPHLRELELHIRAEGLDQSALVHAIQSRSFHVEESGSAGSCLRSADITVSNRWQGRNFDILRSLQDLGGNGMQVRIKVERIRVNWEDLDLSEDESEDDDDDDDDDYVDD